MAIGKLMTSSRPSVSNSGGWPTVDFIVVGAGPAGCAVAARLAQSSSATSVALIEAGPARASLLSDVPLGIAALVPRRSRRNYAYETTPQPGFGGRRGYQPRGRGLGGSSLINAMICTRGQPQDYDAWSALGCKGWGWSDVLPYFKRSEDNARGADAWHGVGGPLRVSDLSYANPAVEAFVKAAVQAGYKRNTDFNGETQEGVGPYQVFQKNGRRYNAARAYLQSSPAASSNLETLADRQARRILFEGRRAVGVAYGSGGAERRLYARGEVIVCGGAFGSPQLLMVSGIGPGEQLKRFGIDLVHDAPEVGLNLQDHCDYVANLRAKGPGLFGIATPILTRGVGALATYLRHGRGLLTSNAAEAGGFIKSRPDVDRPDLQLHFCIGIVDDHNRKIHFTTGMSLHVCGLRPKSRGLVRLGGADIALAPIIDPNFLSDPDDLETLVRGAEIVQTILAQPALAPYGGRYIYGTGRDDPTRLTELIRERADTIYHPVGTCRMGADERSVVDPQLRVRGVDGLRVADASVMPLLVSGNTEAPSAMIGEKAADLILGRRIA
jgi:choline dehydrogenase-like flavoprotein